MTLVYGESYRLPTPTRDGYKFGGWYEFSLGMISVLVPNSGVYKGDLEGSTLRAEWIKINDD